MEGANIRSGDEPVKYRIANSMSINLDMLSMFMKSRIVGKKDCSLVIIIHGHGTLYLKTKHINKSMYAKHLRGSIHHSMVFNFDTGERERQCLVFLLGHMTKVPTNECAVPISRFLITMIAHIARVKVGLHAIWYFWKEDSKTNP